MDATDEPMPPNAYLVSLPRRAHQFGSSVAIDGTYALVGARADEDDAGLLGGSAYVFEGVIEPGAPGAPCTTPNECLSGFCVDDVCCPSACGDGDTGDCEACSLAAGSTADGSCELVAQGVVCRTAIDVCDVAEQCTGSSNACPVDELEATGTVCRPATAECDAEEVCSGEAACPPDLSAPDGTSCDSDAGVCSDGTCEESPQGAGGAGGAGGATSSAGGATPTPDDTTTAGDTCGCHLVGDEAPRDHTPWLLAALGLLFRRRRKSAVAG